MKKLSLGAIEFINSLPIDLGLLSGAVRHDLDIVSGAPAELNARLSAGDLDLGPVSAFWYGKHRADLLLLPDLSISSESSVHSVLLFSKTSLEKTRGDIFITGKGRTTPALLEMLCRGRHGFKPRFVSGRYEGGGIPAGCDAMLLIGDEALLAAETLKNTELLVTDLASEWRAWTGLPIVFAVWAVRRSVFARRAAAVMAAYEALLQSKRWGAENPEKIFAESARRTGLAEGTLRRYFSVLNHGFDERLQKGLRAYFDQAARFHLLDEVGEFETIASGVAA